MRAVTHTCATTRAHIHTRPHTQAQTCAHSHTRPHMHATYDTCARRLTRARTHPFCFLVHADISRPSSHRPQDCFYPARCYGIVIIFLIERFLIVIILVLKCLDIWCAAHICILLCSIRLHYFHHACIENDVSCLLHLFSVPSIILSFFFASIHYFICSGNLNIMWFWHTYSGSEIC
jgi:hypothetical protein